MAFSSEKIKEIEFFFKKSRYLSAVYKKLVFVLKLNTTLKWKDRNSALLISEKIDCKIKLTRDRENFILIKVSVKEIIVQY